MQDTTSRFRQLAQGHVRPLAWEVRVSFDKAIDPGVGFFELDTSLLDGDDLLTAGGGGGEIQAWDSYQYDDYTDRVISVEVTRETVEPYSVVQSFADVTFNNYDRYFTPDSGSPIEQYILPKRPFRILMGFGTDVVPKFVGVSDKMPVINKNDRTATFHMIDFLSFIFEKSFPTDLLLENKTTDEILDEIFQALGLTSAQYVLDSSTNTVPFFIGAQGTNIGSAIKDLMQAELGRLFLDETGVIRFLNRTSISTTSVYRFDRANTIDYDVSDEDNIINKAVINLEIMQEQALQSVASSSEVISIPAAGVKTIRIATNDPITMANTPTYQTSSISDSFYLVDDAASGGSPYASITVTDFTQLATAVDIEFTNGGGSTGYIQQIDIWGTPIKVARTARIQDEDTASIDKYDEKLYEFTTRYISDDDEAISRAATIVNDLSEYGNLVDINVKGSMAIQNGDCVTLGLDGYQGDYGITKTVDIIREARYEQRLRGKLLTVGDAFELDTSLLDSDDHLII